MKKGVILNQSNELEIRERLIKDLLSEYKRSKIKFSTMTQLSEHLAERMSKVLESNVAGSTLRRNEIYRNLLDQHMDKNKGLTSEKKDAIDMAIRLRNLSKINKGLEDEINLLNSKLAEMEALMLEDKNPPPAKIQTAKEFIKNKGVDDIRKELLASYTLLLGVMRVATSYCSDIKQGVVKNSLNNEVVMNKETFPTFFEIQKSDFKF